MYKHMGKVVIKILLGSAVTQTVLGGLTIYLLVANFQCICAKNYGNWLAANKVIAKIIWLTFFGPPCICCVNVGNIRRRLHVQTSYIVTAATDSQQLTLQPLQYPYPQQDPQQQQPVPTKMPMVDRTNMIRARHAAMMANTMNVMICNNYYTP